MMVSYNKLWKLLIDRKMSVPGIAERSRDSAEYNDKDEKGSGGHPVCARKDL